MDRKRRDSPFFDFSFRIRGKIRWKHDRLLFILWTHDFIQILPIETGYCAFQLLINFERMVKKYFFANFYYRLFVSTKHPIIELLFYHFHLDRNLP